MWDKTTNNLGSIQIESVLSGEWANSYSSNISNYLSQKRTMKLMLLQRLLIFKMFSKSSSGQSQEGVSPKHSNNYIWQTQSGHGWRTL